MKRGSYNRFPIQVRADQPDPGTFHVSQILPLKEVSRSYVEWAIRKLDGDKPLVAKRLGISLRTIYNIFTDPAAGEAHA